jgi:hypothetical protein
MMTTKSPLLTKLSRSLSVACLALAFTSGISAVRAQTDVPSWMMVDPISAAVKALEERLTSLEARVASVAESLASRQNMEHELCVADDAGARTCISKAQLDRLLKIMHAAAIEQPAPASVSASVGENVAEPAQLDSAETVRTPTAPETQAAVVEEPAQIETTTAAVIEAPRQAEQAVLPEDTINQDSMPTGSIPAPTQGDALATQPEVEITTPPTEH